MTVSDELVQNTLPIIDLALFHGPNADADKRLRVAKDLAEACRNIGFVYITNHGVPKESIEAAFAWSKKYFDMPQEEKNKAPHPPGYTVHRGYSYPGLEKIADLKGDEGEEAVKESRATVDSKESYEVGSESNADQPNVWPPPEVIPGWREFMNKFYWECEVVSKRILKALALGLGLEESFFESLHSGHNNQLRLLHYPPVPAAELEQKKKARIPAHTDWGTLTMLFQDDCGGLQVEHHHIPGKFIDATPLEGTLVMNVGDLLMRWSNDILKSTSHRVDLPPLADRITGPDRITRARYSIPYFVAPDLDAVVECLPVCVSEDRPAKYGPTVFREYVYMRASMTY